MIMVFHLRAQLMFNIRSIPFVSTADVQYSHSQILLWDFCQTEPKVYFTKIYLHS